LRVQRDLIWHPAACAARNSVIVYLKKRGVWYDTSGKELWGGGVLGQ
jgi:hypothetical protein